MSKKGLSLREFRGSLKKSHCGRFTLSSLVRFFRHNPRTSSQILRLNENKKDKR